MDEELKLTPEQAQELFADIAWMMDFVSEIVRDAEKEGLLTEVLVTLIEDLVPEITKPRLIGARNSAFHEWDI